jgi:hypothetical protein
MSASHVDVTEILVAIPMVCGMFLGFFRLDELFSKHKKPGEIGHALSNWDEQGCPLCIEPDGTIHSSGNSAGQRPLRRKGPVSVPRRRTRGFDIP